MLGDSHSIVKEITPRARVLVGNSTRELLGTVGEPVGESGAANNEMGV